MQNLHANFAVRISGFNGLGDQAVHGYLIFAVQHGAVDISMAYHTVTFGVGGDTTGHYHTHSAFGSLGKVGGHFLITSLAHIFQAHVHGSHQYAIFNGGEAQIEGLEGMWVFVVGLAHGCS